MAEESNAGPDGSSAPQTSDPVAWAALSAADREHANAFLEEQKKVATKQATLLDLQAIELAHELRLRHWSLRVRHMSDVLKLTLEVAVAIVGVAVVAFLASTVWDAVRDNSLVIEAFDVPADYAARGMTGKMVAGQLMERLSAMQQATGSVIAPSALAHDWGDDYKVQIPESGLSLGELNRYLHAWLGNQTRITGELYRTDSGMAATVHVGTQTMTSRGGRIDDVVQSAAEAIFRRTQPYLFGQYLRANNRTEEARTLYERMANDPGNPEQAWGYVGLHNVNWLEGDYCAAEASAAKAVTIQPDLSLALFQMQTRALGCGHDEAVLRAGERVIAVLAKPDSRISERARNSILNSARALSSLERGDFPAQYPGIVPGSVAPPSPFLDVEARGFRHDADAVREAVSAAPLKLEPGRQYWLDVSVATAETALGHWHAATVSFANAQNAAARAGHRFPSTIPFVVTPLLAEATFEQGDHARALALIALAPADCYLCQRVRGKLRAEDGQWGAAVYWFIDAIRRGPDLPFAYTDWGAMLLHKGDYDAAIAKFQQAHGIGPHFADPMEMWGEALMEKNRSDLALAKFEEANRYAPNWGRLHLEWGEALLYAGKKDEARKQFLTASALDLSASDRAALARVGINRSSS